MTDDDLTQLSGVGPATAEKLTEGGYSRIEDIAVASPGEISADTSIGNSKASGIINSARDEADVAGFQTGNEALSERQNINKITTGHSEIDNILEGGVEERALTELFGEHQAGKSQFTHQLCVNVQLPKEYGGAGKRAIYIDTEDSYRPERIVEMVHGLDDEILQACMERDGITGTPEDDDAMEELTENFLSRVHNAAARNTNMQIMLAQDASDIAEEYRDTEFPVGLLAVDSVIVHFRAEYIGRGELAERQQQLTKHMDDLTNFANRYDAAVLIANQVLANPDQFFGDPMKAAGGNVIKHRSTFRVKLRQGKKDKMVFMLEDAPNLADGQAPYLVTENGIEEA